MTRQQAVDRPHRTPWHVPAALAGPGPMRRPTERNDRQGTTGRPGQSRPARYIRGRDAHAIRFAPVPVHPRTPTASAAEAATQTAFSGDALVALRSDMLRFARLQLRDAGAAEDAVQEAMEAAWRQASSFARKSSLKTWVFGILRHRIVDHIRRDQRTLSFSSLLDTEDEAEWQNGLDQLFKRSGQWQAAHRPEDWPNPEAAMADRQFWQLLEQCLQLLPAATGKVFMMREALGFEVAEICERLGITPGNCHVILHRARLKLRGCIAPAASGTGAPSC